MIWRFLPYSDGDAATNMATDEAILESHIDGLSPPTLRLYGFRPAAVSIGLSQKMPADTVKHIIDSGFDVVRRPTGGRAVLHQGDLTYSFIGASASSRHDGFLSDSITESYKQICAGLMEAFRILGLESELGETGSPYRHLQDCFLATTGCDLHHRGVKLIGSAQVRRRGAVLQHGSVPLRQEASLMSDLLGEPVAKDAHARHVNLFDALGKEIPISEFENAFAEGFARAFGTTLERGALTDNERRMAGALRKQYELPGLVTST